MISAILGTLAVIALSFVALFVIIFAGVGTWLITHLSVVVIGVLLIIGAVEVVRELKKKP